MPPLCSTAGRSSGFRDPVAFVAKSDNGRSRPPGCCTTPGPSHELGLIAQPPGNRAFFGAALWEHRQSTKPRVRPLAPVIASRAV